MSRKAYVRRSENARRLEKGGHPDYACESRVIVGHGDSDRMIAMVHEVPPGKSAVPYHYHLRDEELFFILRGEGRLRTPEGERTVTAGDYIFFPNNEHGAHKLTNVSETEPLVYLDVDVVDGPEVAVYPDSGKIGVFGDERSWVFPVAEEVDYFNGE